MTYQQTLTYLYRQLPMFQRIGPPAMKKDLGNTRALLTYLGQPETKFPSVHLAGTNGKGSTAHAISAALQTAGWKTGLYTSPHYRDFRERIRINGELMPTRAVVRFVEEHRTFIEEIRPSFFEITVAMAFDQFAREGVDIAVIETGLGGRLDSTNVLQPLTSVITNIGYDHQEFLGDTLPEIAGEKAGIIKTGTPVVIGQTQEEIVHVFREKAAEMNAPLLFADQIYRTEVIQEDITGMTVNLFEGEALVAKALRTDLAGPYQVYNLNTAYAALDTLGNLHPDWRIDPTILATAWKDIRGRTGLLGRWQQLGNDPLILADAAHNPDGLAPVLQAIRSYPHQKLHIVLGIVADKDPAKSLRLFPAEADYYFAKANIPRGLDAGKLRDTAATFGLHGKAYTSIRRALAAARRRARPDDLIYVGGSIFTVAEVV